MPSLSPGKQAVRLDSGLARNVRSRAIVNAMTAATLPTSAPQPAADAPVMRGHPLFGNMPAARRDMLGVYHAASTLGGVVRVRTLPIVRWYTVFSPAGVERVLHSNQRNYRKPPFVVQTIGQMTGASVFTI